MSGHDANQDRERELTRREASRILLGGGVVAVSGLALASAASAQPAIPKKEKKDKNPPKTSPPNAGTPSTAPAQPAPSWIDDAMRKGKTHDWVLKPTVHIQAYQEDPSRTPKDRPLKIESIAFKTAAVLFPVIRGTGSSQTDIDNVKSELTFNDRTEDVTAEYNESYHAGERLGRWEMKDKSGKEVELKLEIPMTSWETVFDETAALQATWPMGGKWPRMAQATFGKQACVDLETEDSKALKELLDLYLDGQQPQSMPPMLLAKMLCGKVAQNFQPNGDGQVYDRLGVFTGLALPGPKVVIPAGKGSPHDIASILLGLYRAAGLPARLVIAYDESENKGNDAPFLKKHSGGVRLRSWVEFCLVDENPGPPPLSGGPSANKGVAPVPPPPAPSGPRELWVPADPVRIRKRSSQIGKIDQPWKFFGTHDELVDTMPFAFHFIPPTTVVSYGYAFWGWFTTPTTQVAEHWVRFTTQTAVKRPAPKNPPGRPIK